MWKTAFGWIWFVPAVFWEYVYYHEYISNSFGVMHVLPNVNIVYEHLNYIFKLSFKSLRVLFSTHYRAGLKINIKMKIVWISRRGIRGFESTLCACYEICALSCIGGGAGQNNEAVGLGSFCRPAICSWWVCHWFSSVQTQPLLLCNSENIFSLKVFSGTSANHREAENQWISQQFFGGHATDFAFLPL